MVRIAFTARKPMQVPWGAPVHGGDIEGKGALETDRIAPFLEPNTQLSELHTG